MKTSDPNYVAAPDAPPCQGILADEVFKAICKTDFDRLVAVEVFVLERSHSEAAEELNCSRQWVTKSVLAMRTRAIEAFPDLANHE